MVSMSDSDDDFNPLESTPAVSLPEDLAALSAATDANPRGFDGWVTLLNAAEQTENIEHARYCFDRFFLQFPLCFGYWKKYADLELRKSGAASAKAMYERGLTSVPISVDLWNHYLNFLQSSECASDPSTASLSNPDNIRSTFRRAVTACGRDWRAHPIWDSFIKWETGQENHVNTASLLVEAMTTPIQLHIQYLSKYRTFVNENDPELYLTTEEMNTHRTAIQMEKGEMSEIALKEEVKTRILDARQQEVAEVKREVEWRAQYEDKLKRNYFHVKALERNQLQTWRNYLEAFAARENITREDVDFLYERSLVPCALYDEFWLRYARHVMDRSLQRSKDKLTQATVHCVDKPSIHLLMAALEEKDGEIEVVRAMYEHATRIAPALIETAIRWANMELRSKALKKGIEVLDKCFEANAENKSAQCFLVLTKADLLGRASNSEKAMALYEDAMNEYPTDSRAYSHALNYVLSMRGADLFERCEHIFEKAMSSELTKEEKVSLARRRVDICDRFAPDVNSLLTAQVQYYTYAPYHDTPDATSDNKRRATLDPSAPSAKMPRLDESANGIASASTPSLTPGTTPVASTAGAIASVPDTTGAATAANPWGAYPYGTTATPEAWAAYAQAYPGYNQWGANYAAYYPPPTSN